MESADMKQKTGKLKEPLIKKRCVHCNKKLKMITFTCKNCHQEFCVKHQQSHSHNCKALNVVKTQNMKRIQKLNPKVMPKKVVGI